MLVVTAQAMQGDRERFKEAGFDGYLSKPVDIDELLTTIEQHLRGARRVTDEPAYAMVAAFNRRARRGIR